ncbi:MAG TPA: helix-turn-helix transcriptional regulator [Acidimicrobiia bacterium]|jgi:transcriptional regulator with XRE-family HTH domain
MSSISSRADLSEFLKARRAALTPADVGLPAGQRRRTTGLRREEVSLLADVSVSWYTWLEQGRPIKASAEVLDALARALRLDDVERDHLFALAGHPQRGPIRPGATAPSPAVVRLLDSLAPAPAYLLGARWDLIAWNEPFALLFPPVLALDVEDRNLVWIVFADADARALIGNWEHEARRVLSQFRAEIVPWRDDPAVARLVARLQDESDEFAQWWPRHDVGAFETHRRVFHHARAGRLEFETQQLVPVGEPDQRIVVHLPIPGDDSAERLLGG